MRYLLILAIFLSCAACSRNGSLLPKVPEDVVNLPEVSLSLSTLEDTTLSTNVLTEIGINSGAISVVLKSSPLLGTMTLSSDGALSFTPPFQYSGTQSFEVEFLYKTKSLGVKTISLTTISVNDSPVAANTSITLLEDAVSASGSMSATDIDSTTLTYSITRQGSKGSVVITDASTGAFEYIPFPNANGADSFSFKVSDGNTDSNEGEVSVSITPVNDAPTASDFTVNASESVLKSFTLNGFDVDGDSLTYSISSNVSHGTLSCTGSSCSYTSNVDATGDSFVYEVSDGNLSSSVTVTIDISPVNNAPESATFSFSTNEDTMYSGQIAATDSDSVALTYIITEDPTHGTLVLNTSTGSFDYTPSLNYNGPDSFKFKVKDSSLETPEYTASITVVPVNDPPTAQNLSFTIDQNEVKAITLLGQDVDSSIVYTISTPPSHGSVLCTASSCEYTPTMMYSGSDSFVYQVSDGSLSATATVSLTISNQDKWWNPSWSYRRKIALSNNLSLTQNTFLIKLNSSFPYNKAKSDGADIRFVTDDGVVLPYSVDTWNTAGDSVFAVKSSVTAYSLSDYIWMYYGNSTALNIENKSSTQLTGVVGRFKMTAASGEVIDDKGGLAGIISGAASSSSLLGEGVNFSGTTQKVEFSASSAMSSVAGNFSVELLVKETSRSSESVLVEKRNALASGFEFKVSLKNGVPYFQVNSSSINGSYALASGKYYHVTATYDGTNCRLFVNSAQVGSGACAVGLAGSSDAIILGNSLPLSNAFVGTIDEFKMWSKAMAADEIRGSYQSVISYNSVVGSEQAKGQTRINHMLLAINSDQDDGSVISTSFQPQGYYTYLVVGDYNGASYWSYLRFQTSSVLSSSSIIYKAKLRMQASAAVDWNSSLNFLTVVGERTNNSSVVSASTQYPGGSTGAAESMNQILWGYPGLSWTDGVQESDDLSSIVQEIVDDFSGVPSGNSLQMWARGAYAFSVPGYLGSTDFSNAEKTPTQLFIEWK